MIRSLLFIPGNSPGMLLKSDFLGAGMVILDLEDAIPQEEKDAARTLVYHFLKDLPPRSTKIAVRVNSLHTKLWAQDIELLAPVLNGSFILPKAEDPAELRQAVSQIEKASGRSPVPSVMPLLETSRGIENAYTLATSCDRVAGLLLGGEDLSADMGCERTPEGAELSYARSRVVNAASAAGVPSYDTPYTEVEDEPGLAEDVKRAKSLGFSGKLAIHPLQVPVINRGFSPSQKELSCAREIIAAYEDCTRKGLGVISLHGKMIDAPVVERARHILLEAEHEQAC